MKLRGIPLDGRQPELFRPDSDWVPFTGPLPRLEGIDVAIDTETRDDGLASNRGPGWVYDMGYLCGVSVAWATGRLYLPIKHPDTVCRELPEVLEWLGLLHDTCVCHYFNAGYDLGWLVRSGLRVWPRRLHDASLSYVMLDENQREYSLDNCCRWADVPGKDTLQLTEAARAYGTDPRAGLWRLPARYVGPYAEQDAVATLALSLRNLPLLRAEGQERAYDTECRLVRVIHDMRDRGIRVSESRIGEGRERMRVRRDQSLEQIRQLTGLRVDMRAVRSPEALGRLFATVDISPPRTPKTHLPSVTREWLEDQTHPLADHIRAARRFDDLGEKFIGTYIAENMHRGRVHAEIHQLRDESGGTRTHRLSYANPPLQQSPARPDRDDSPEERELATLFRSCFLPEGDEVWFSPDYSGQEPRFVVHLAAACGIPSGQAMAERWRQDPHLDYHQTVADIIGLTRAAAKDLNQALAYGIGIPLFSRKRHISEAEGKQLVDTYHERLPYPSKLSEHCSNMAQQRGWIRLVDGARLHFDAWQPAGTRREVTPVHGLEKARERWPETTLRRAFVHKAMNGAAQGGSARQMKIAMVRCYEAGLTPLISLHDELGFSVANVEQCRVIEDCMVNAVQLSVPMVVDLDCGPDWGRAKHSIKDMFGEA